MAAANTRSVSVHLLPELVEPQQLAGKTAVVIDVLRALVQYYVETPTALPADLEVRDGDEAALLPPVSGG